jgi:hypothetical protein
MLYKGEMPLLMRMVISLSNEILNYLRASPFTHPEKEWRKLRGAGQAAAGQRTEAAKFLFASPSGGDLNNCKIASLTLYHDPLPMRNTRLRF